MSIFERILVPVDGSPQSRRAIELAIDVARLAGIPRRCSTKPVPTASASLPPPRATEGVMRESTVPVLVVRVHGMSPDPGDIAASQRLHDTLVTDD